MSDLGQLLQVIHDSRNRWRTFRGEYRLWRNRERSRQAFEEIPREDESTTYGSLKLARKGDAEPPPAVSEGRWRIWVERPDSIREDFEGKYWGAKTTIKVGKQWWTFDEHWGAKTNEGSDVTTSVGRFPAWLEPASLLGLLRFQPLGSVEVAGRPAIRALATPAERGVFDSDHLRWMFHHLGDEAEEFELAVDRQTGTLLRVEARFQGEPLLIGEAEVVAFDEEFPPETFVFTLPEGEEFEPLPDYPRPTMDQAIHEAAADASFTVFMLPRLPEGWSMVVYSTPARKRPPRPPYVGVNYEADSGAAGLELSQRAHTGDQAEDYEGAYEFEDVRHSGLEMKVFHRTEDLPYALVLVTRDGTDLAVSSHQLSGEKLIEVAADLVPAPMEPPEL